MKATTLIAFSLLAGTTVFAQDAQPQPERQRGNRAPGMQRQLPPELMKEFDKDGNGELSQEERTAMQAKMREQAEARRKADLEKYDANKDGKLDEAETKTMREARQKEMLEKYDTDKDGKLSDEERKAMPPGMQRMGGRRGPGAGGDRPARGPRPADAPPPPPPAQ